MVSSDWTGMVISVTSELDEEVVVWRWWVVLVVLSSEETE